MVDNNYPHIFILGSVCSGLGKGNFAASLGRILQELKFNVVLKKIDGYLNIDAGTINPLEHGEVFVTSDGHEGDLDLGTYERFMDYETTSNNITTMGKIIFKTLMDERNGKQLGKTIENYHIIHNLLDYIYDPNYKNHINIIEVGGVIGHDNQAIILKAINQVKNKLVIVLSYGLWLDNLQEYKALPMIFGLQTLQSYGISSDFLCIRTAKTINDYWFQYFFKKINNYFNYKPKNIMLLPDLNSPYGIYNYLYQNNKPSLEILIEAITHKKNHQWDWSSVEKYSLITENIAHYENYKNSPQNVKILILGKYGQLHDSYTSIYHSLYHSSADVKIPINIEVVNIENFDPMDLKNFQGIIIPGGFGFKGTKEIIDIIRMARSMDIPVLGICLGMQLMVLEGLNNLCNIEATSQEFASENPDLEGLPWGLHLVNEEKKNNLNKITGAMGGNMRLGTFECNLQKDSLAYKLYKNDIIFERHRHRYEVNNEYIDILQKNNYIFSGINGINNLMEIIEYKPNKFFIGCQFHPEFKSKIHQAHPLFNGFIEAANNYYNQSN